MDILTPANSLICLRNREMENSKRINPLDLVQEQFQLLKERLASTADAQERMVLLRRIVNIVGVIHFLMAVHKGT